MSSKRLTAPDRAFLDSFRGAPHRILFLDYDGTLAPFREKRDEAFPYPWVREALGRLMKRDSLRVMIVSGRAVEHLAPLLQVGPPLEIFGSHGWEYRDAAGVVHLFTPNANQSEGIRMARDQALSAGWGELLEVKPLSVALHWREFPVRRSDLETWTNDHWRPLAESHSLDFHGFDGGYELRIHGRDKGVAVAEVLAASPKGTVACFCGDDRTDEDAFKVLRPPHCGILVREEFRPTAAQYWLPGGEALKSFLESLATHCEHSEISH